MPPPAPKRFRLVVALVGYLATAACCVVGMTAVLVVWALWALTTVAYLAWTGRFADLRARRWK